MCSENQEDNQKKRDFLGIFLAFVLGGIAGRGTRERIRNVSTDIQTKAITAATTATAATAEKVTDLVSKGKARIDDAAETVKSAVEAGKTAYSDKKSEMTETLSSENNEEKSNPAKKKDS